MPELPALDERVTWEEHRIFRDASDDELARYLAVSTRLSEAELRTRGGHAYTERACKSILNDVWPAKTPPAQILHRHLDEFVAYVGFDLRIEPDESPSTRLKEIEANALAPSRMLQAFVKNNRLEFIGKWRAFAEVDLTSLQSELSKFEQACELHAAKLRLISRKGKSSYSDYIAYFVDMALKLAIHFNRNFVPARSAYPGENSRFLHLVETLAEPIFVERTDFVGAVRKRIDAWNAVERELSSKSSVAEKN